MICQNKHLKAVNIITVLVFLCTNCAWADELAVGSQLADVLNKARVVYTGTALHSALVTEGISKLRTLYENQDKIRERLRERIGDAVDSLKTLIFEGKGGLAYYTFTPKGYFYRFTTAEEVDDPFYRLIQGYTASREQKIPVPINGDTYYQEIIQTSPPVVNLIDTVIGEGILEWTAEPKSHLFPRYLHIAIERKLVSLKWKRKKIDSVLRKGAGYYDSVSGNIVIDDEALLVISGVLSEQLGRDVTIDSVRQVIYRHEQIEQIIAERKIDFESLLKMLMKRYSNRKIKGLLDGFCNNYAYSRRLPDAELLRELLVHHIVETQVFNQPVRILPNASRNAKAERKDIEEDIADILEDFTRTSGIISMQIFRIFSNEQVVDKGIEEIERMIIQDILGMHILGEGMPDYIRIIDLLPEYLDYKAGLYRHGEMRDQAFWKERPRQI